MHEKLCERCIGLYGYYLWSCSNPINHIYLEAQSMFLKNIIYFFVFSQNIFNRSESKPFG